MSDKFERELREQLHKEAAETPQFPRALRSRIADGVRPHGRDRIAPQLALAGALVIIAIVALGLRNSAGILNTLQSGLHAVVPTASPSAAPTPAISTSPSPSASASSLGAFGCTDLSGGTPTSPPAQLARLQAADHPGYDRVVFEFAGSQLPAYTLTRQSSTTFTRDASGQQVTLQGSSGLKLVFHGAAGYPTYTGSTDLKPGLPVVKEIEQIGDFEGVMSWGFGLSQPACVRMLTLSNPTRLVIDVQAP
jgi:hypothetical protein